MSKEDLQSVQAKKDAEQGAVEAYLLIKYYFFILFMMYLTQSCYLLVSRYKFV